MPYLETSAKSSTNVEQAFLSLTSEMKNRFDTGIFKDPKPLILNSGKDVKSYTTIWPCSCWLKGFLHVLTCYCPCAFPKTCNYNRFRNEDLTNLHIEKTTELVSFWLVLWLELKWIIPWVYLFFGDLITT